MVWDTEKGDLGAMHQVEITPEAALYLENDADKSEFRLAPGGTYRLLAFLGERATQICEKTHKPKTTYYNSGDLAEYTIIEPGNEGDQGEHSSPPGNILYADPTNPYLAGVLTLAKEWGQEAYNGPVRIVRVVPAETSKDTPEVIPDFLLPMMTWTRFTGQAEQSWAVTILPLMGWQASFPETLYVHLIGDGDLITGGGPYHGFAAPRTCWVEIEEAEDQP